MSKTQQDFDFQAILPGFDLQGDVTTATPYGSGHINDTFLLTNSVPGLPDYLLQRINHHVFKDVPALMRNIERVTTHLKTKLDADPGNDLEVLTPVKTHDGGYHIKDSSGNYWRVFHFLKDTISYDVVLTAQQAEAGGAAFGQFQSLLSDLPATSLTETIPDFHNIAKRLGSFHRAIERDVHKRVMYVAREIKFIEEREEAMSTILRWGNEGRLPRRITHNDTKFNNVLLDTNDRARCVIDLDTVMPGYVAYDFGDAVRTLVNTAAEDEKDVEKINVNLDFFEAFTRGFLRETIGFLTPEEIRSLSWGVLLLPYIMAVRFLTDYLEGDVYYKTAFAGHNLQRCRAQLQLIHRLEEHYPVIEDLINRVAGAESRDEKRVHENRISAA